MARFLVPRPFLDSILVRGGMVWVFARAAAMVGTLEGGGGQAAGPVVPSLAIIPIVVLVMFIDTSKRNELIFLANLGHSFRSIALILSAECFLLETVLRLALV